MPQFDTFIFSSVLFYFILGFLVFLYINAQMFLPYLGAVLKLRNKLEQQTKGLESQEIPIPIDIGEFPNFSKKIQE